MSIVDKIKQSGSGLPPLMVLYAVEGFGKSTIGSQANDALVIMPKQERGLETLLDRGLVDPVDNVVVDTYPEFKGLIHELLTTEHGYKSVVIDTFNILVQEMLYGWVLDTQFGGDPQQYKSWGNGKAALNKEISELMMLVGALREKGITPVLLMHAKVTRFSQPGVGDYNRYQPYMDDSIWDAVKKAADLVLFGNFKVDVDQQGKASGGKRRMIYTEHDACFDAKNRHGLPAVFSLGEDKSKGWATIMTVLKKAKEQTNAG